jgi:soluble lytic murein transglycosylase-like protein
MPIDIVSTLLETHAVKDPSIKPEASAPAHAKTSFWHQLISHIASTAGIDPELAVHVAAQESGLNPHAVNQSSGAIGMMQLMPGTAAALGVNPHDVMENIRGGVHYLRDQLAAFGDKAKALAAYNWGPRHVTEAVDRWGSDWLSHTPKETQRYVASILSRAGGYESTGFVAADIQPLVSQVASGRTPSSGAVTSSSAPSHRVDPELAAKVASLRSALDAYLLSEILS